MKASWLYMWNKGTGFSVRVAAALSALTLRESVRIRMSLTGSTEHHARSHTRMTRRLDESPLRCSRSTHTHSHTHARTHTHARVHAHTHTQSHTQPPPPPDHAARVPAEVLLQAPLRELLPGHYGAVTDPHLRRAPQADACWSALGRWRWLGEAGPHQACAWPLLRVVRPVAPGAKLKLKDSVQGPAPLQASCWGPNTRPNCTLLRPAHQLQAHSQCVQ